jgi:hypothetical protein
MNLFLSLVRRGSVSEARNSSSSSARNVRIETQSRRQANMLADSIGRMEDRG